MQRAHTHTHSCKHAGSHSPVFGAARYSSGFLLLLIFGSFQLQIPEPELFSAPLPDPPNWERLWLRKRELNRQRERGRGRADSCAKESKNKRMSKWKEQRARPVQASARQVEDGCALNSWPHESRTSFLPSALYLLLSGHEPNRAKHNVAFQYSIW